METDKPQNATQSAPSPSCKYEAFISYRHLPRDEEVAQKIQKAIEGFRLPKSIARPDGRDPQRLGKCFRDADELTVGPSLPAAINDALATSSCLIVVCSPETAESRWVRCEIDTFASMHGTDRIFTVLASGTSQESIPDILRPAVDPLSGGSGKPTAASPLAADLRASKSRSKQQAEMLRLIAAVAGCDYDDLRRRDDARWRKRVATGGTVATLVLALVIALGAQAHSSRIDALIAESQQLAAVSSEQMSRGERMQAIQTALDALPSSAAERERPLVPEAQSALEAALEANPDPTTVWRPSFVVDAPARIARFVADPSADWVAILDESGSVGIYSLKTGRSLRSIDLHELASDPEQLDVDEWTIVTAGPDRLVVANREGAGSIACFDAASGSILWQHEDAVISSISVSDDGSELALFSVAPEEGIIAGLVDAQTGDALAWTALENPGFLAFPIFLPSILDGDAQRACLATGGSIVVADFHTATMKTELISDMMAWSVKPNGDTVLVALSHPSSKMSPLNLYAELTAASFLDASITWTARSSYSYSAVGKPYQSESVTGDPRIWGLLKAGGEAAVAWSTGATIHVSSLADGHDLATYDFMSAIVGTGIIPTTDGNDILYIATADGTLDVRLTELDESVHSNTLRKVIPYTINDAIMQQQQEAELLAIMQALDQPERLVVYHQDTEVQAEPHEYGLDELLALAREVLSE